MKDNVTEKIIRFIEETGEATIGEIYIRFHMMNKGNEFSYEGDMSISEKDIIIYVYELCKNGILSFKKENSEGFYYLRLANNKVITQ